MTELSNKEFIERTKQAWVDNPDKVMCSKEVYFLAFDRLEKAEELVGKLVEALEKINQKLCTITPDIPNADRYILNQFTIGALATAKERKPPNCHQATVEYRDGTVENV